MSGGTTRGKGKERTQDLLDLGYSHSVDGGEVREDVLAGASDANSVSRGREGHGMEKRGESGETRSEYVQIGSNGWTETRKTFERSDAADRDAHMPLRPLGPPPPAEYSSFNTLTGTAVHSPSLTVVQRRTRSLPAKSGLADVLDNTEDDDGGDGEDGWNGVGRPLQNEDKSSKVRWVGEREEMKRYPAAPSGDEAVQLDVTTKKVKVNQQSKKKEKRATSSIYKRFKENAFGKRSNGYEEIASTSEDEVDLEEEGAERKVQMNLFGDGGEVDEDDDDVEPRPSGMHLRAKLEDEEKPQVWIWTELIDRSI